MKESVRIKTMAEKFSENTSDKEFCEIISKIERKIKIAKSLVKDIYIHDKPSDATVKKLEEEGFTITSDDNQKDGYWMKISW